MAMFDWHVITEFDQNSIVVVSVPINKCKNHRDRFQEYEYT